MKPIPATGDEASGHGWRSAVTGGAASAAAEGNGEAVDFRAPVTRCENDVRGKVPATSGHTISKPVRAQRVLTMIQTRTAEVAATATGRRRRAPVARPIARSGNRSGQRRCQK